MPGRPARVAALKFKAQFARKRKHDSVDSQPEQLPVCSKLKSRDSETRDNAEASSVVGMVQEPVVSTSVGENGTTEQEVDYEECFSSEEEESDIAEKNDDDPSYSDQVTNDEPSSDEEYVEDSEIEEDSSQPSEDETWAGGRSTVQRVRPSRPISQRVFTGNAFNNGVGAELVPWLKKNFRLSHNPNVIMPRSHLYCKYQRFCAENNLTVVNSACLGKVLRRTFPGVDTRRLGRRGESKYHYIGLEINPGGVLDSVEHIPELPEDSNIPSTSKPEKSRIRRNRPHTTSLKTYSPLMQVLAALDPIDRSDIILELVGSALRSLSNKLSVTCCATLNFWENIANELQTAPDLVVSETELLLFMKSFHIHLNMISHCISSGAFLILPRIFMNFWSTRETSLQVSYSEDEVKHSTFILLTAWKPFQDFVVNSYIQLYQRILDYVAPSFDVAITGAFAGLFSEFIVKYPTWVLHAVQNLEFGLKNLIYSAAAAFANQLNMTFRLSVSYSKVALVQVDTTKAAFLKSALLQLQLHWRKVILRGFTKEDNQHMSNWLDLCVQCMDKPEPISFWRLSVEEHLLSFINPPSSSDATFSDANTLEMKKTLLQQFKLMWYTLCKHLSILMITEIRPVGKFQNVDPVLWLIEFYQRYVRYLTALELEKLQAEKQIRTVFKNVMEDLIEHSSSLSKCDTSLHFFTEHLIDTLEYMDLNDVSFFGKCPNLRDYLPQPVKIKVEETTHEDIPIQGTDLDAPMKAAETTVPKTPSLLEMLLRRT